VLRKLTTKPVWWWERKRNYGIRARFDRLPPIPVHRAAHRFVVLTSQSGLNDALWTAWSWYRYLCDAHFELQFITDGETSRAEKATMERLFPGVMISGVETIIASQCAEQPVLEVFVQHHPLGKKLAVLLALSRKRSILYSDHDVLAFNSPIELLVHAERDTACYMQEEHEGNWDPFILEQAKLLELECITRFNSGLLHVPQGALSVDLAVRLLDAWRPPAISWFTEQTVLNVLMGYAHAKPLPRERYVVSNRRQFYWEKDVNYKTIVARHFTGTTRHVMYGIGMPIVLRQSGLSTKAFGNA
jgi:hypothetical protein